MIQTGRATLVALAVLLIPVGRAAAAGTIVKGTVTLPEDSGSVTNVVVYLEGKIGVPTPGQAVIDQKNMQFVPHVLPVVVGSTVEFRNSDPVLHNVFSIAAPNNFDLGMFGQGESRRVTFSKPGIVRVRCNVHPGMLAYVLVLENSYFATPDDRGNFQISGIPPGRYKLRAWHESLPAVETWANLEEATLRTIDVRFTR
jgi:plastocyanin